jgi:hypothetical protein
MDCRSNETLDSAVILREICSGFHQSLQVNVAKISQLRHDHFLPNPPFVYLRTIRRYVLNFLRGSNIISSSYNNNNNNNNNNSNNNNNNNNNKYFPFTYSNFPPYNSNY